MRFADTNEQRELRVSYINQTGTLSDLFHSVSNAAIMAWTMKRVKGLKSPWLMLLCLISVEPKHRPN